MTAALIQLDPTLTDTQASALLQAIQDFGPYPMYVQDPITEGIGKGLVRRHDAVMHYVKAKFEAGLMDDMSTTMSRLNLFRGAFAEGDRVHIAGLDNLLYHHQPFLDAAAALTGKPVVVPDMLYANFLLPGQELIMHTDTPEYRGLSKHDLPEWVLVVMMHSGLFEDWRVRIAGGVSFFHPPNVGGAFLVYPGGPAGPVQRVGLKHNTSVLLDADALFHGVECVGDPTAAPPTLKDGSTLAYDEDGSWVLSSGGQEQARYRWGELRLSIQWKAHCFADDAERRAFADHTDDLTWERVRDVLVADLRDRGLVEGDGPDDTSLALLLMDTYIRFPGAA